MKYPCLVPSFLCKTSAKVKILGDLNEDGEQTELIIADLKCNYQDKAKRIIKTKNGVKEEVQCSGTAYFSGDIAPSLQNLSSGKLTIFGETHEIALGSKARNIDGSVNYTRLEII